MVRILSTNTPSFLTPPLKKVPDCIVTKYSLATPSGPLFQYRMADTRYGSMVGEMFGRPVTETMFSEYYPIMSNYNSFYIEKLIINDKGLGYGSKFINFAKSESLKLGCGGKVHVTASRIYSPKNPPHLFYRKNGFTSRDTGKIAYFDKCIKKHKQISPEMADNLAMYLPVCRKIVPKSSGVLSFLMKLFK